MNAFLRGIASLATPFAPFAPRTRLPASAYRDPWEVIGEDLWKAIERLGLGSRADYMAQSMPVLNPTWTASGAVPQYNSAAASVLSGAKVSGGSS